MSQPVYQAEAWYVLLRERCHIQSRAQVAAQLGVSAPVVSQVLNGSGKYGTGEASTRKLADRVLHTFGRYPCPHLTAESGDGEVVVSADRCRDFAHRPVPIGSPRDIRHWQACQACPHKAASAPPVAREVKPRKPRSTTTSEPT